MIRKIISIVLLVILLVSGWVVYQNWNTIQAFIHSLGTSVEQTEQELEENKKQLQEFIEQEEEIAVRDLTKEESEALNSGKLSEEEIIDIITGRTPEATLKPSGKPVKPKSTPTPTPTPKLELTSEEKISQLIAKLYVQKSQYLNKLDNIEQKVRNEFINNPGKWESKKAAKQELLNRYLPEVAEWEKTCDVTVYGILDEIRTELKNSGKDETVVDAMKQSYLEEKKLKKSYFINRYMD